MLTVQNLTCRRGGSLVFRDTSFAVKAGGFVLVTGANGSGKSSLLRLLAGLLPPHDGTILWQNQPVADDTDAHRARTHYIGHLDAVKTGLTVIEMLEYWQNLRGVGVKDLTASLSAFGLTKLADRPIRRLSAGQKKRLSLTRLMLDTAPLWLLDEPTTALDSAGQDLLRTQIARHRAAGGIVIAASHDDLQIADAQNILMTGAGR